MSANPGYDDLAVGSTMEDTFLRDFMSAGVYDFASDIGIIQDGQIPSVKLHEQNLPVNQWSGAAAAGVGPSGAQAGAGQAGAAGSGAGSDASATNRNQRGQPQPQQQHFYNGAAGGSGAANPNAARGGEGQEGALGRNNGSNAASSAAAAGLVRGSHAHQIGVGVVGDGVSHMNMNNPHLLGGGPGGHTTAGVTSHPMMSGYPPAGASPYVNTSAVMRANHQHPNQMPNHHPHSAHSHSGLGNRVTGLMGHPPGVSVGISGVGVGVGGGGGIPVHSQGGPAGATMPTSSIPTHSAVYLQQQQQAAAMAAAAQMRGGVASASASASAQGGRVSSVGLVGVVDGMSAGAGAGAGNALGLNARGAVGGGGSAQKRGKGGSGAGGGVGSGRKKGSGAMHSTGLVGDKGTPSTEGFQLKKKRKSGKGSVPDKGGKGLRHFSMKVCAKVESKGRTTYNEVADELVSELSSSQNGGSPDVAYDEKNIRRRVYDALNVLMAMDIISKEKKEISWKGLPTTRENNFDLLKEDQKRVNAQVEKKQLYLKELVGQKKAIEALIERNKANPQVKQEQMQQQQQQQEQSQDTSQYGVQLPFLVVQTRPDAKVDVQISEDRQFVSFDFTYNPFEIHDENYVLHNMVLANKLKTY